MMYRYQVSYDLHDRRDYEPLWSELYRLGGERVLLSHYIVESTMTAVQLDAHLRLFIDKDDSLIITELCDGAQWTARVAPTMVDYMVPRSSMLFNLTR